MCYVVAIINILMSGAARNGTYADIRDTLFYFVGFFANMMSRRPDKTRDHMESIVCL